MSQPKTSTDASRSVGSFVQSAETLGGVSEERDSTPAYEGVGHRKQD